ncbi:MAG: hypothetical protein LBI53_05845 [Candidatus Peribacteria bacterium]|jgi:regulator of protease activity HflC (stomatin/prohibitin superfamily)|nr:hypothetical protein [Candidatus Peribacteria bacterium]
MFLELIVNHWWIAALVAIFAIILLFKSIVNVKAIAIVEHRYIGKEMADGRTVALPGEVGVRAKILGPGLKLIIPFIQKVRKHPFTVIGDNQVGYVIAISGAPIPTGKFMAQAVECNAFQDGVTFLRNGGQKGAQITTLPPGEHRINPHLFSIQIRERTKIEKGKIGLVESIDGVPIPSGRIMAKDVECNFFQDARAFFENGGEKGPQITIIPPGDYRINPYLFKVKIVDETKIEEGQIGLVESIDGKPIPPGRIMAESVICNLFQNAKEFLENDGQKGPQLDVLTPGDYRINTYLFKVKIVKAIRVPDKHIRTVTAIDGGKIPEGKILAKTIDGHSNFEKGSAFLSSGGEKGQQSQYLMPGTYRINTNLFEVSEPIPWIEIEAAQVGIVTTLEGKPLTDKNKIAAEEIPLEAHSNFQNVQAFLDANGQKGLQIPVLRAGSYPINPWFATVEKQEMVNVGIGECAVITSFVGDDYTPEQEEEGAKQVNAKLVPVGKKGIWKVPLGPGLHPLNSKICAWNIIPTIQVVLSWNNNAESQRANVEIGEDTSFEYDKGLKAMVLTSKDGFQVPVTVKVMFHIPMEKAPAVVADLGSMRDMITQVLEPRVSAHFRNEAQQMDALEIYRQRSVLSEKATVEIAKMLAQHHVGTKGVMLLDVFIPEGLMEPVKLAAIAIEDEKKYKNEEKAQNARKNLEFAKKQADMQDKLVESERKIEISKNDAESSIKTAEGDKAARVLKAEGQAQEISLVADAEAGKIKKVGLAEAEVVLEKGKSQATAYDLSQKALGADYARLQIIEAIAQGGLKIIPENILIGGGEGGGIINQFLGISMIEKLTGKPFNTEQQKLPELVVEESEILNDDSKKIEVGGGEDMPPSTGKGSKRNPNNEKK